MADVLKFFIINEHILKFMLAIFQMHTSVLLTIATALNRRSLGIHLALLGLCPC